MTRPSKETAGAFLIVYLLVIAPLFLHRFDRYLRRPAGETWNEAEAFLSASSTCPSVPIVFRPSWYRNYAADFGRFADCTIAGAGGNLTRYWLVSPADAPMPQRSTVEEERIIGNLRIALVRAK